MRPENATRPTTTATGRLDAIRALGLVGVLGIVGVTACAAPRTRPSREIPDDRPLATFAVDGYGFEAQPLERGYLIFGGRGRGAPARRVTEWIDPRTGTREQRADLRAPANFHSSAAIDGAIYSIAHTIERYDPQTGAWSTVLDDPRLPQSHSSAGSLDGDIFILGGIPNDRSGYWRFTPKTGLLESLPTPPDFHAGEHLSHVIPLGDTLHFIGGLDGESAQPMATHRIWTGTEWRAGRPPPGPLEAKFGTHAVVDGKAYIFSGFGNYRFDPAKDEWQPIAPLPAMVVMPTAIAIDRKIYVFGGMEVATSKTGTTRVYDTTTNTWE